MLNISFIALAYLLVYVGAVSILFLFILMLINIRVSELTTDNSNSIPLSVIIITIFTVAFSGRLLLYKSSNNMAFLSNTYLNDNERIELLTKDNFLTSESFFTNLITVKDTNEQVSMGFSCIWENVLADMSHITSIGNVLYVSYTIGILIVGLILLLSMIGAISVTSTNKN
jgi:NADH-ubiquinone oxidoreductase chain 6